MAKELFTDEGRAKALFLEALTPLQRKQMARTRQMSSRDCGKYIDVPGKKRNWRIEIGPTSGNLFWRLKGADEDSWFQCCIAFDEELDDENACMWDLYLCQYLLVRYQPERALETAEPY